ncbi:hypothetical protein D2Q93_04790 [Alicyclobacillaceae bacterium I2511]|nr:hypothetical protein D2Q93_04790 [Alicyclobacillaceae bacterium I2511]
MGESLRCLWSRKNLHCRCRKQPTRRYWAIHCGNCGTFGGETVRQIFRHPAGLVGTDGIFGAHPHPRLFGTAARVLGRYAMREKLISVEQAVARLTAKAADRLGLRDRGRIQPGLRADLVLLDLPQFVDTASYEDPKQTPPGVVMVWVGGQVVRKDGKRTDARPGGVLGM